MSGRPTENPDTFRCACSSSEIQKDREKTADGQQIQKAKIATFKGPNTLNTCFSFPTPILPFGYIHFLYQCCEFRQDMTPLVH